MKKIFLGFVMLMASFNSFSQIEGNWKIAPQAGALGVGPTQGNISWWSNSVADLTTRVCFFDDKYVFNEDGSFTLDIQKDSPGKERESNWLPAPDGPFYCVMRL